MKILKDQHGHSSLTVLLLLFSFSLIFIASSHFVKATIQYSAKQRHVLELQGEMLEYMQEICRELEADETPESHWQGDRVREYLENPPQGYQWELIDLSSRLNPNFLRFKLFEETRLRELIQSGDSPEQLDLQRMDRGFSNDLYKDWEEVFGEENLETYFTLYSLANVNVTQEDRLEELYRIRAGDNGANAFRSRIQEGLQQFRLWNEEDLSQVLGREEENLRPVIGVEPLMNVHSIDPFLLEALLSYPYREDPLPDPHSLALTIIELREQNEITPEELKDIIGPTEKQMRVLEYLGTRTSFWELRIESEGYEGRWILFQTKEDLQVIEQHFGRIQESE